MTTYKAAVRLADGDHRLYWIDARSRAEARQIVRDEWCVDTPRRIRLSLCRPLRPRQARRFDDADELIRLEFERGLR